MCGQTITSSVSGTVIRLENAGIIVIVATERGESFLDCNLGINLYIGVGDRVEVENAPFYITNGRIVTVVENDIVINGIHITWKSVAR